MDKLNIKPIRQKRTTKEIVYSELKSAILNGQIKKGEIFTETELAYSLNTSRTPVREVVSDLIKDGLLVSIPRKGLRIREISEDEKNQIAFLRLAIETEGIKQLSKNVTEEQIEELQMIVKEQEEAMEDNDRLTYIDLDQTFHRTILHFSNLYLLEEIFQGLYNLTRLIGHRALRKEGRMKEVIQEHFDIIQALQNRDGIKAKECLEIHLLRTMNNAANIDND